MSEPVPEPEPAAEVPAAGIGHHQWQQLKVMRAVGLTLAVLRPMPGPARNGMLVFNLRASHSKQHRCSILAPLQFLFLVCACVCVCVRAHARRA